MDWIPEMMTEADVCICTCGNAADRLGLFCRYRVLKLERLIALDYSPDAPLEQAHLSYKIRSKPPPGQETVGNQIYAYANMRRFNTGDSCQLCACQMRSDSRLASLCALQKDAASYSSCAMTQMPCIGTPALMPMIFRMRLPGSLQIVSWWMSNL